VDGTLEKIRVARELGTDGFILFSYDFAAHASGRADGIVVGYIMETNLPDQAVGVLCNRLAPWGYAYFLAWSGRCVSSRRNSEFSSERPMVRRLWQLLPTPAAGASK
jgi:hypothetical protein